MKMQFLVLMEDLVHQKKTDIKANTKSCFSLHYNIDNSYLFVNGKEICKFKASNKNVNFPSQFYQGSISKNLTMLIQKKYL